MIAGKQRVILAGFGILALAFPARAGATYAETIAERAAVFVEQHYVFPAVARKAATYLRRQADGGAYRGKDGAPLAEILTADLQARTGDKHLTVSYSTKPHKKPDDAHRLTSAKKAAMDRFAKSVNYGFGKIELLPGGIGYLRVDGFMPADVGGPTLAAAMRYFGRAKSLIVDLRHSEEGGDPSMVALICAYLTDNGSIHLTDIRFRNGHRRENWTPEQVATPRFIGKRVFVLTSHKTFSAGEELAYDLQALKRARVIGEPTGGGANPGHEHWIDSHFTIFVPDGQALSAITGKNWGSKGVIPDVAVPPAKALAWARRALMQREDD